MEPAQACRHKARIESKLRPACGEETRHSSQFRSKAYEHSWDRYLGGGGAFYEPVPALPQGPEEY